MPALWTPPLAAAAPRGLCTDCGVSRMRIAKACGRACQFIAPDYPAAEAAVHGRARDPTRPDELHFGPFRRMLRASLREPRAGAQWTGIATRLGERLLETGLAQAVLTVAPTPGDPWRPRPVIVTRPEEMAACRGMRMGYAPTLALLEPALEAGLRRLALIGIPCQVHALRKIEALLGLEKLWVVGTPCSDNTTTERFHSFLALLDPRPETITYLEFRADYRVELRYADGRVRFVPFLELPIAKLPPDFFPLTCRTCVDYTNVLSDLTVGYMGGSGRQWLLVRNPRGEELVQLLGEELLVEEPESRGRRTGPVRAYAENVARAAGGLPLRRMPDWLRPIAGRMQRWFGPKGLEFARTRVEMKALETVLHLRRAARAKMKHMIPEHLWRLVEPYGLRPEPGERAATRSPAPAAQAAARAGTEAASAAKASPPT
ncbi:MAG: Coenzyme F420 hydrogenase/dehydrogenase, beta subunit C-terminal domain [Geminicoccaceae bacterium]|nr:Coenzyme F420 hydrogenase/dehydrogenase, beta subunit C-terminal domain [Geminicoccaceae bacterium]